MAYGTKVTHGLHQITSQTIGTVVPCWREQADQAKVEVPSGSFLEFVSTTRQR